MKPAPDERLTLLSARIPVELMEKLDAWPGLTRSQALREALERYFMTPADPDAAYAREIDWARSVYSRKTKTAGHPPR